MRKGFYSQFAFDSLCKNRRWYLPYALACTLMQAMLYIIAALAGHPGLGNMMGGSTLGMFLMFGIWVIAIFAAIFLKYTHNFLMKQRRSEFGLYHVLGMEKRHVARILAMESLLVALGTVVVALGLGILLNKLALVALVRLLGAEIPLGFRVSVPAIRLSVIIFGVIHLLLYASAVWQLRRASAVDLLKSSQSGEREPKARWLLAILGVAVLAGGYVISIVTKEPLLAIPLFFLAVVLVIAGTYLLFMAGSIAWLKLMQRRKGYYYRTRHFIGISGMLHRMKQNAAGLASICILSTMVLVTVSATTSLYLGMQDNLELLYPRAYGVQMNLRPGEFSGEAMLLTGAQSLEEEIARRGGSLENPLYFQSFQYESDGAGGQYLPAEGAAGYAVTVACLEDYNAMSGGSLTLQEGQALICTTKADISGGESIRILGSTYQIAGTIQDKAAKILFCNNTIYAGIGVVVPSRQAVDGLYGELLRTGQTASMMFQYFFDAPGLLPVDEDRNGLENTLLDVMQVNGLQDAAPEYDGLMVQFGSRAYDGQNYAAIFAGLFFAGIFLSAMFLMATILIIYYKQISEGLQDVRRFAIMKKVGLSDREIRSSIRSQVMTVFFLPLITAGIHCAFSFPIINRMLAILSMTNTAGFLTCMGTCFGVFALIYVLVYTVTARAYYRIVSCQG